MGSSAQLVEFSVIGLAQVKKCRVTVATKIYVFRLEQIYCHEEHNHKVHLGSGLRSALYRPHCGSVLERNV